MRKGRKRIISRVMGIAMTAVLLATSNGAVLAAEYAQPNAESEITDGEITESVVEESSDAPVEIASAEDLAKIGEDLSADYILTQDIDLKNVGGGYKFRQ